MLTKRDVGSGYEIEGRTFKTKTFFRCFNSRVDSEKAEVHGFSCLQYVDSVTEKLQRVLTSHGIKVCVKSFRTIRQSLAPSKDPVANQRQTGVVYTIPCADYDTVNIGEPGRAMQNTKEGHMASVRLGKTDVSALAEQAWNNDHHIDWDNTRRLSKDNRWAKRMWIEVWHIACTRRAIGIKAVYFQKHIFL